MLILLLLFSLFITGLVLVLYNTLYLPQYDCSFIHQSPSLSRLGSLKQFSFYFFFYIQVVHRQFGSTK